MSKETKDLLPEGIIGNFGVVESDSEEEPDYHISIMHDGGQFVFAKEFHKSKFLNDNKTTYGGILWNGDEKKLLITISDKWKNELDNNLNSFSLAKTRDQAYALKVGKITLLRKLGLLPSEKHKYRFALDSGNDDMEINHRSKYIMLDFSNKSEQPTDAKVKADAKGKYHRYLRRLYTEDPEGFARKIAEMDDPRWWESNEDFWQEAKTYRVRQSDGSYRYDTHAASPPKNKSS